MPAPSTCTVSGTLYGPGAVALSAVKIKCYVTSPFTDASGNYIPEGVLASTTSDDNGAWSLAVVQTEALGRSVTFQFEYPLGNNQTSSVKYAAVIPDDATADFSDLVNLSTGGAIIAANPTTDSLAEGVVNLYFTAARALAAMPATTKGDILVHNGTALIRLPVGTNGHVLTADSAEVSGLKYASSAAAAVSSVNGATGVVVLDTDDIDEGLTNEYYTDAKATAAAEAAIAAVKAQNSGLASLDSGGKVPQAQMPAIAITDTFVVASEAAMLALSAETGDVAVRTDESTSYILQGTDPTVLGDWQELLAPTGGVATVNGQSGTVVLDSGDIAEVTNLYFTDERAQDAVGGMVDDSTKISLVYTDGTPSLVADIVAGSLVDADISTSAAIARSKIATATANRLVVNADTTGALSEAAAITAARVLISDANGIPVHSSVTSTTLGYLDATSSIQTQLDAKLASTGVGLVEALPGMIEAPEDKTYVLDQSAAYAYTINTLIIATVSGTTSAAVKINGTNVTGISAVSVSSTPATGTGSAANSVSIGDKVTLVLSSSSTPVDLSFTLKVTRA